MMREFLCASDCVALYDDEDDNDQVIVEPSFLGFTATGSDMQLRSADAALELATGSSQSRRT